MVPGAPDEARWIRSESRRILSAAVLERIVHTAIPRCRVVAIEPLADGLRNTNFRLHLDSTPEWIVLRVYEHDRSLCQKEIDLIHLVGGAVPVPELIHAEPGGWNDLPPFALLRYVEGISFHDLMHGGDTDAIRQAAFSAGQTLAGLGRFTFAKSGWLAPGPTVTRALLEGENSLPRFVDLCLASTELRRRMPWHLCDRTHQLVWSSASQLAPLAEEACLVHGDFNRRNLLVRPSTAGRWAVVAVLDWEFAISGSPLGDFGNFLRYECASYPLVEPHFSAGYCKGGGRLPKDWRRMARLVDLTAVCESLTHGQLPDTVVAELVELVRSAVENRDPQLQVR